MPRGDLLLRGSAGTDYYWDRQSDGRVAIHGVCELDDALDHNKALATENDGWSETRELRRVASIPLAVWHKWLLEEGWDAFDGRYADRLRRKLNDPDWRWLRTAPGRV